MDVLKHLAILTAFVGTPSLGHLVAVKQQTSHRGHHEATELQEGEDVGVPTHCRKERKNVTYDKLNKLRRMFFYMGCYKKKHGNIVSSDS